MQVVLRLMALALGNVVMSLRRGAAMELGLRRLGVIIANQVGERLARPPLAPCIVFALT